jgi:hypothetical protein
MVTKGALNETSDFWAQNTAKHDKGSSTLDRWDLTLTQNVTVPVASMDKA